MSGALPALAASGMPGLPLMAVAVLAALGWILAGRWRLVGSALALLALGALAALAIYVINGVEVAGALRADPMGALVWFAWVGAQLAGLGIVISCVRLWVAERGAP